TVFTATTQIQPGTAGAELPRQTAVSAVPSATVPAGAVSDLAQLSNAKAVTTIFPGQVLITSQFGDSNVTGGLPVPVGKLGMAVTMGDPERVASFVQPGAKVTIFNAAPEAKDSASATVILRNITVLAVGPSTMTTRTNPQDKTTTDVPAAALTVSVSDAEAARLAFTAINGHLYFGLQAS
ncbi:MAG: RcpC/CpaB family pilus assembly protein, partial [Actinomycetes bacterium]